MSTVAKSTILLVEDDRALRELLIEELQDAGWTVRAVSDAEDAWERLQGDCAPAIVLSDLRLPAASGMELMTWCQGMTDPPGFVLITAFGTIDQAVDAIKRGADDFITKPIDFEHLLVRLERVMENRSLRRRVRELESMVGSQTYRGMVGRSRGMRSVFDMIERIGGGDGPVLIIGESGTGKELVARAVHAESRRADRPFVEVNCAGMPAELLESEFFGHVKGAFTGAHQTRPGLLQQADGGVLFLDEIGEMPASLQAKLLRVLEDGVVRPVGSDAGQRVDVRIIAATNRDLARAMGEGEFREDLFYRLETFQIQVPRLSERQEDIELLAMRFLEQFAEHLERDVDSIDPIALQALRDYAFPGNVRELRNVMERAVTFCRGDTVTEADLPEHVRARAATDDAFGAEPDASTGLATLEQMESRYIRYVLERCAGNKQRAAELLGIGRRTLYRKLDLATAESDSAWPAE